MLLRYYGPSLNSWQILNSKETFLNNIFNFASLQNSTCARQLLLTLILLPTEAVAGEAEGSADLLVAPAEGLPRDGHRAGKGHGVRCRLETLQAIRLGLQVSHLVDTDVTLKLAR